MISVQLSYAQWVASGNHLTTSLTTDSVGIGIAGTPASRLDVNGTISLQSGGVGVSSIVPNATVNGSARTLRFQNSTGTSTEGFEFYNSSVPKSLMMIEQSGNVGLLSPKPTHTFTLGSTATGITAYNTSDQTTNYERVRQYWNNSIYTIASEAVGTGNYRDLWLTAGAGPSRVLALKNTAVPNGAITATVSTSTASASQFGVSGVINASSGLQSSSAILPQVTQTGTAAYTALWISPYENTTGSGNKHLIDAGTNSSANGAGTHTSKFVVTNAGFVGIGSGNNNPSIQLSVDAGATTSIAQFKNSVGSIFLNGGTSNDVVSRNTGNTAYNDIDIRAQDGAQLYLKNDGTVGIGVTSPDAKLAVNGIIHAKEVKVDLTGWPDYVFKPQYKLPSLSEVKTYIDQYQHLPGMPSEQEVAKNGITLGEIIKNQTKTIEELTLYLIEKDTQLDLQNNKLVHQQKEIDQLKQSVEALTKEFYQK